MHTESPTQPVSAPLLDCDVVVLGGGTAGIGVAASLRRRRPQLGITIVEPSDTHYYQPAWTLVGGGVFDAQATARQTDTLTDAMRALASNLDAQSRALTQAAGDFLTRLRAA